MPLLARVYPNGAGDVNNFHAAGGIGYVVRELLGAGLLHGDVLTVGGTMADYGKRAGAGRGCAAMAGRARDKPRRHHAAPRRRALLARRRHAPARGQSRPRDHQDQRGRRRSLDDRGAVPDLRQSGCGAGGVQGGRTRTGRHRRRPLSGAARQWHARTAQADPARSACCRTAASASRCSPTAACRAPAARCPR